MIWFDLQAVEKKTLATSGGLPQRKLCLRQQKPTGISQTPEMSEILAPTFVFIRTTNLSIIGGQLYQGQLAQTSKFFPSLTLMIQGE